MKTFQEINESIYKSFGVQLAGNFNRYTQEQKNFVDSVTFENYEKKLKSEEFAELFPYTEFDVYVNFRYKEASINFKNIG